MTEVSNIPRKLVWLPSFTAILAFIACNGMVVVVSLLSLLGVTLVVNPHIQAAAISLFALLTLAFVVSSYRRYRRIGPVILAGIGAALIVGTMYITFNKVVESVGLVALITSAIWSWRAGNRRRQSSSPPSTEVK
jgi:hypothetical protein